MNEGGGDLLDFVVKLSGLSSQEFSEKLDEALKAGYVTKPEFERFVHGLKARSDSQDELIRIKIENVQLQLEAANQAGLAKYIEEQLPAAVAKVRSDNRNHIVNFVRQRAMLIVSFVLMATSMINLYAAYKNAADVRNLKNLTRVAEEIDNALNP